MIIKNIFNIRLIKDITAESIVTTVNKTTIEIRILTKKNIYNLITIQKYLYKEYHINVFLCIIYKEKSLKMSDFIILLNRFQLKSKCCTVSVFIGGACVGAVISVEHDAVHVTDWCRVFCKSVTHVIEF